MLAGASSIAIIYGRKQWLNIKVVWRIINEYFQSNMVHALQTCGPLCFICDYSGISNMKSMSSQDPSSINCLALNYWFCSDL